MLGTNHFCTYHSFAIGWSPYSFGYNNTCWDWYFLVLDDIMKYMSHVTPSCPLSCPTFRKPSDSILSPITCFFGRSPTWARICITSNKCSFKYRANTFSFMCKSRGRCLIINSPYHTCISSIFNPFPYITTYMFCLATSYGCPFVTMSMWSCHWRFRYPFFWVPLWGEHITTPNDAPPTSSINSNVNLRWK